MFDMLNKRVLLAAAVVLHACATTPGPKAPSSPPPPAEQAHHGPHGGGVHHRFDDALAWAKVFDDPRRDAWQKPEDVISALSIAEGAKVADVGAGTGYFAARIAKEHPTAQVYGVDIEPDMVRHLDGRAKREGLPNLRGVLALPEDPKLPEPVDLVLVVDTYHHLEGRAGYFRRLLPVLRPGAKVAIIDFTRASPRGPPQEHKLEPSQVVSEMAEAGFTLFAEHRFLPDQYFLVFSAR